MTKPEVALWRYLKGSPAGVRFRRQYPLGPFVADFYCPAAKLVIEIDGQIHEHGDAPVRDQKRDLYVRSLGLQVLRVPAQQVLADAESVADGLVQLCAQGPSTMLTHGPPPHEQSSQGG